MPVLGLNGNGIDFLALPPDVAPFDASLALLEAAPAIDMPFLREAGQLSSPGVPFDLLSLSRRTSACLVESSVDIGAAEPLLRPLMDIEPWPALDDTSTTGLGGRLDAAVCDEGAALPLILYPEADVELLEPDGTSSSNAALARPAIERDPDALPRPMDSLGGDLARPLLCCILLPLLPAVGESISPSSTSPASRMLSARMGMAWTFDSRRIDR